MVVETLVSGPASSPLSGAALNGITHKFDGSVELGDIITAVNGQPINKVCTFPAPPPWSLGALSREGSWGGTVLKKQKPRPTGRGLAQRD
jgi:hypothetical protein